MFQMVFVNKDAPCEDCEKSKVRACSFFQAKRKSLTRRCLMKYGCHVIWAVRSPDKAESVLNQLEKKEGKFSGKAGCEEIGINMMILFLSAQTASVDSNQSNI